MANDIRVVLEGGPELAAKLRLMGIRVQDVLEPAVQAGAMLVRDVARGGAPGPHVEMRTTRKTASLVEVSVGPDRAHWYYRFFETGTAGHGPRRRRIMVWQGGDGVVVARYVSGVGAEPFLRPAMDNQGDAATDVMGRGWRVAIESVI
jgi:HK97 gp10 family phage protein